MRRSRAVWANGAAGAVLCASPETTESREGQTWFSALPIRGRPADSRAMARTQKNSPERPDDQRPGRLPAIMSSGGNLIWSCPVYAQPGVRLVLRAGSDGNVWASIG